MISLRNRSLAMRRLDCLEQIPNSTHANPYQRLVTDNYIEYVRLRIENVLKMTLCLFSSAVTFISFSLWKVSSWNLWSVQFMTMTSCLSTESKDFGPSVVVHTSVPFGVQHLEEEKDAVQNIILEELEKVMPGFPQPDSIKCQKWRYSQVRWEKLRWC